MKIKIYDPMPRNPETAQRVRACALSRAPRIIGVIDLNVSRRSVRVLKSGKRRITYK